MVSKTLLVIASVVAGARALAAGPAPVLFPAAEAREVCPDTRLRLTFDAPAALGEAGAVVVTDVADGAVVDRITIGNGPATQAIGGIEGFRYHPVMVDGADVTIHLRH